MEISNITSKVKSFVIECKRVLQLTKKPNRDEFKTIVKASAIGIAIIGILGFIIQMTYIIFLR
ncbi:MAG: protein translocase SEC61 complex subunit gamma [Nanoarchaeota archaeon]|jgi:protein transport protein SEC61 subunit gamma-like protein